MDKKWTIKEICDKIKKIEKENNLFSLEERGVKIWEVLRFKIYYKITQETSIFEQPQNYNYDLKNKIKLIPIFIKNSIMKNPFLIRKKFDVLLLDHPRKILKNSEYIDIYTDDLLKTYLKNESVIILEKAYRGRHWSKEIKNRFYTDVIELLVELLYPFCKKMLIKKKIDIKKEINDTFNINIDIDKFMIIELKKHIIRKELYKVLLKKLRIKKVFLVVSYMNLALIDACKDLKIKVTELQHGTISEYHLGYSYSEKEINKLKLFPDEFFSFGNYWNKFLPLNKEKIINYGFKEFENFSIKHVIEKRKISEKYILFISQAVIGEEIFNYAYKLSSLNKKLKIKIKLHPSELDKSYYYKEKARNSLNFEIIDSSLNDLYLTLLEAECIIGVFSTVIYEALSLKKEVVLINLPGVEYMEELIVRKICKKANNVHELNNFLKKRERTNGEVEWKFF